MLQQWSSIAGILCAVLLLMLLYVEVKRVNRSWLFLRLLATVVAVASLAFMAIPVYRSAPTVNDNARRLIIISEGYDTDSVLQFLGANSKSPAYFIGEQKTTDLPSKVIRIRSEAGIKQGDIEGRQIHLFGSGLQPLALEWFGTNKIVYHKSIVASGLQSISWNRHLYSGDRLVVQGTYVNSTGSSVRMLLNGFGSNVDTTAIAAGATASFQLTTIPKFTGRAQYSLLALKGTDTLLQEPLPVEIETLQPFKILMLSASPDFDNKFLKNWLTQNNYKVAIRTATSKAKFATEFVNMPVRSLSRLSADVLASFDVVITEGASWNSLSASDKASLIYSIDQKGLGLIVKADSSLGGSSFYGRHFKLVAAGGQKMQTVELRELDSTVQIPPLLVENPLHLRADESVVSLLEDQQSRSYAGLLLYGSGRVAVTTLAQSYQWILAGRNDAYQSIWSRLINAVVRRQPESERWAFADQLPVVHEANTIQVTGNSDSVPVAQINGDKVYMMQDENNGNIWYGTYWPTSSGWQTFVASNGSLQSQYVFGEKDFETIQSARRSKAIEHYLENRTTASTTSSIAETKKERLPIYWFFFLFILATGFLWVEKKFL